MTSLEQVLLKSSCDTCTASKVKCSGGAQCTRCKAKGIACFYSPRKKRGSTKRRARKQPLEPDVLEMTSTVDPTNALNALGLHEKRSWSVFFTLYKHYGSSCSRFWFQRQLNKMRHYLKRQNNVDALHRLTQWMEALNVDVDGIQAQMDKCMISIRKQAVENARRRAEQVLNVSGPLLQIKGELRELQETEASEVDALIAEKNDKEDLPFLKITTQLELEEIEPEVEANGAFTDLFGYTPQNITAQLRWTGGGFLPWGGDVLSRLLTNEKDLLAFVQIMAIKFQTLGKPHVLPTIREVPSAHKFPVSVEDTNSKTGSTKPVPCIIKCVHREVLAVDRSYMEMYFTFQPLFDEAGRHALSNPEQLNASATLKLKRKLQAMLPNLEAAQASANPTKKVSSTNVVEPKLESTKLMNDDLTTVGTKTPDDMGPLPFEDPHVSNVDPNYMPPADNLYRFDSIPFANESQAPGAPQQVANNAATTPLADNDLFEFEFDEAEPNFDFKSQKFLEESGSSTSDLEDGEFTPDDIDGQWLDSLLDWVKAE